jgi:hypothetical protein
VLELPDKLAVQQHLHRGWGPFLGGPAELGALVTSGMLAVRHRSHAAARPS